MRGVTKDFIDYFEIKYPIIVKLFSIRRYLAHLQFGSKCKNTGFILLDNLTLAKMEYGIAKGFRASKNKNYSAIDYLTFLSTLDLPKQTFLEANFTINQARCVDVIWDVEDLIMINSQYNLVTKGYKKEDLYNPYTGNKYTKNTIIKEANELKIAIELSNTSNATKEQLDLINILHSVDRSHFTKAINTHLNAALEELYKLEAGSLSRIQQEALLQSIIIDPFPLYKPSSQGNTVRLFPANESILGIKSPIRKAILKGNTDFDLHSAQYAIIGRLWQVDSINNYLKNPLNCIWKDLHTHIQLVFTKETKKALKVAIYSICFGGTKKNITRELAQTIGEDKAILFNKSFIIRDLYSARKKRVEELGRLGYMVTVYGKKVYVEGQSNSERAASKRSILAQEAQALEHRLLEGVVALSKTTSDWNFMAFQSDGFTVKFTSSSKKQRWIKRILQACLDKAAEYNVYTYLEYEHL